MKPGEWSGPVPKATAFYRRRKDDPLFLRQRREYTRLYRETHPPTPQHEMLDRVYHSGCAVCGERAKECLDVYQFGAKRPLTIRSATAMDLDELADELRRSVCLCANCRAKYRYGRIGLPHWVPDPYRWSFSHHA